MLIPKSDESFSFVLFPFPRDRMSRDLLLNLAFKRQNEMEKDRNGVRTDRNMRNLDEDENTHR